MPGLAAIREVFQAARAQGWGQEDIAAVVKVVEAAAGLATRRERTAARARTGHGGTRADGRPCVSRCGDLPWPCWRESLRAWTRFWS